MWATILSWLGSIFGGADAGAALGPWLDVLVQLVGTFALIATLTATSADNKVADLLVKIIHFLGANFGKAKNVA